MSRCARPGIWLLLIMASLPARADLVAEVNRIRKSGCDDRPAAPALKVAPKLDSAARSLSRGRTLRVAMRQAGYGASTMASIRIEESGDDRAVGARLRKRFCARIMNAEYREIGTHRIGNDRWVVLAAPFMAPRAADAVKVSERVLALVNEARSRARHCGRERYPAAPPLERVPALDRAAHAHAVDMARHQYFDHVGRDGSTPGDRLNRTGYQRRLVGENIAAGPETPDEVVKGWLDSPEHCANIMDARFEHMGVAYELNPRSRHGVYWAQVFAAPR